ncbi:hypothetical protein GCM10011487_63020 [Steroidobacter agaridevorans]|uniref:Uncharacterized protein n=1 Tax=Steroidobacter agaridevorans TaxID=2695856 RepID=A0A829YN85_9GAMM|nr:hypothetical protein [Steroidobacter agaridevorans]GFE84302.1 hypothetical protein GCM10011487_63020 [Steroidobacter agaridevorans]
MIHRNLLSYRGARYLWWSLGLIVAACVLYVTQGDSQPPNGGTWQGYVLGTVGALLIVWLTMLGVRKRRYSSTTGTVQGWTSAHVYLGSTLIVIATLHSGIQVGWNLHTLAYVLMCVVILSGFFGLYTYMSYPQLISKNREGGARAELFAELFELDRNARSVASRCAPDVAIAVDSSIERTTLGGGIYSQLFSRDGSYFVRGEGKPVRNTDQQQVIDFVGTRLPRAAKGAEAANLQQLIVLLCRRQAVLRRIRRDIRLYGWLKIWLYFHVPVTIALLIALVLHIIVTFFYW